MVAGQSVSGPSAKHKAIELSSKHETTTNNWKRVYTWILRRYILRTHGGVGGGAKVLMFGASDVGSFDARGAK